MVVLRELYVTMLSPSCFPSPVKNGLILEYEAKKAIVWLSLMSECNCWSYFTKKWRTETLHPGLGSNNFKPWLKTVFSNASRGWTVRFFGGDERGFLKAVVKAYMMVASMSPLANFIYIFFFSSHWQTTGRYERSTYVVAVAVRRESSRGR